LICCSRSQKILNEGPSKDNNISWMVFRLGKCVRIALLDYIIFDEGNWSMR
jgi:hypothetical protein